MPRIAILRAFALLALLGACEILNPVGTCACDFPPPFDIVYGVVVAPGGATISGATVHANAGPPGCQSTLTVASQPTDAAGRYRVPVTRAGNGAQQCVRLVALAPPGSGWRDSDTLRFTLAPPVSHPPDSVRYDLALRAP
ncbi:MAG TPA: carboxypeptidase-like regulatory domain-containing protein [Longimicrobium sp.]|jgi:hypothetical protein|nr:carboxypeptidase-like regulatory domain-containing protein [Longimicrobium sp.]